ncbi:YdbL family protein [Oceanospirillum sediminis]|uniref:YdbL family protein n=1 Tax=Oceanospirillum sediminis TaxID=2760088 RepID=A0A839IQF3_9GAMM|nr:YdbL family protein [Oceanospirillum sediminis]MBB1486667.1 YdbL family protein [Oceanospirillum sediminis]
MKLVKQFASILLISLAMMQAVMADELDQAKNNGWVGERYTGYLGIISQAQKVKPMVDSVNAQRKAHYKKLAIDNGIPLQEVEKLAGKKVINKTRSGHFIDLGNGWVKK